MNSLPFTLAKSAHAMPSLNANVAASLKAFASVPSARVETKYLAPAALVTAVSCTPTIACALPRAGGFLGRLHDSLHMTIDRGANFFALDHGQHRGVDLILERTQRLVELAAKSSHFFTGGVSKSRALQRLGGLITRRRGDAANTLAMPASSSTTNCSAASVETKCVPPQNSIEYSFHFSSDGLASTSSMLGPTETTRTGSAHLAEHSAQAVDAHRLVERDFSLIDAELGLNLCVHHALDAGDLLRRQLLVMRKVESQLFVVN